MFSRRRFLQTSALVGAGLALPFGAVRKLLAETDEGLLEQLIDSQFENVLPNPLDPDFIFRPRGQSRYEIGTYQTEANILGDDFPATTVWGYGNNLFPEQGPTYPGRTFEAFYRHGSQIRWTNNLPGNIFCRWTKACTGPIPSIPADFSIPVPMPRVSNRSSSRTCMALSERLRLSLLHPQVSD